MVQVNKDTNRSIYGLVLVCCITLSTQSTHGFLLRRCGPLLIGHIIATFQTYEKSRCLNQSKNATANECSSRTDEEHSENAQSYRSQISEQPEGFVEYWLDTVTNTEPIEKALHGALELLEEQKKQRSK